MNKGVGGIGLEGGKGVVDVAVVGFVRSHGKENVAHEGILCEAPIGFGNARGRLLDPGGHEALVQGFDRFGVGPDGLLFQVSWWANRCR